MEDFRKKALAILNKLTPKSIKTLVTKFQDLIDTQDKLAVSVELLFEKLVDEPAFSATYAQLCKEMQMKKVPVDGGKEGEYVNFRKILISRYFYCIFMVSQLHFEVSERIRKRFVVLFLSKCLDSLKKYILFPHSHFFFNIAENETLPSFLVVYQRFTWYFSFCVSW